VVFDRTAETAVHSQIRSLRPLRLIPSEPPRNWFGQKMALVFNALQKLPTTSSLSWFPRPQFP
jgi:hypothetical protein